LLFSIAAATVVIILCGACVGRSLVDCVSRLGTIVFNLLVECTPQEEPDVQCGWALYFYEHALTMMEIMLMHNQLRVVGRKSEQHHRPGKTSGSLHLPEIMVFV